MNHEFDHDHVVFIAGEKAVKSGQAGEQGGDKKQDGGEY